MLKKTILLITLLLSTLTIAFIMPVVASAKAPIDIVREQIEDLDAKIKELEVLSKEAKKKVAEIDIDTLIVKYKAALAETTQQVSRQYEAKIQKIQSDHAKREAAYENKLREAAELADRSLQKAQRQERQVQELLTKLGAYGEKVKQLMDAVSVSSDGSVHIQNLKTNNIKTKEAVEVKQHYFIVKGDFDKFYPIVFLAGSWSKRSVLEIVHETSSDRLARLRSSTLISLFTFRLAEWRFDSNFSNAEIHQSRLHFIAGYDNFVANRLRFMTGHDKFVAKGQKFVIWLRGGGIPYLWRGNHDRIRLIDFKAEAKELFRSNNSRKYEVKTEIEPHLKKSRIYPWDKQIEELKGMVKP
jgi:hypothetical protein